MIKARIYRDNQGNISGFEISGHAGYAESGSDIICAAVSAVAYTAIGYFSEKKIGGIKPRYSERDGYIKFTVPTLNAGDESSHADGKEIEKNYIQSSAVMEAAYIGLKQIELSYGTEYIKVID